MSNNDYELVAWTNNGEVFFSFYGLQVQDLLMWNEYYSCDCPESQSWESFERLSYLAFQWGMLLLKKKDYWAAYSRFVDGIYVCQEAMRHFPTQEDSGINPFLLALDDLYYGCKEAALEEGATLEEVFYEDGIHDYRRGKWLEAATEPTD